MHKIIIIIITRNSDPRAYFMDLIVQDSFMCLRLLLRLHSLNASDGSGSKIFDPDQFFVVQVGSAIYILGLGLENFP